MLPARKNSLRLLGLVLALCCVLPAPALAGTGGASPSTRASKTAGTTGKPGKAAIRGGKAIPPSNAPKAVRRIIAAANRIVRKPYVYGGGHGSWNSSGYDCSGSVSYALHGAGLLSSPLTSGDFAGWGRSGRGRWVSIYANGGHVYMVVAGLRFDTGYRDRNASRYGTKSGTGPRWNKTMRSSRGFRVRHIRGL